MVVDQKTHGHMWKLQRKPTRTPGPPWTFFWTCWCGAIKVSVVVVNPSSGLVSRRSYITYDDSAEKDGNQGQAEPAQAD